MLMRHAVILLSEVTKKSGVLLLPSSEIGWRIVECGPVPTHNLRIRHKKNKAPLARKWVAGLPRKRSLRQLSAKFFRKLTSSLEVCRCWSLSFLKHDPYPLLIRYRHLRSLIRAESLLCQEFRKNLFDELIL